MGEIPEWALKYRRRGVEIRDFGGRYYAYNVRSVYDREKKRARKITGEYIGVVTRDGIVKKSLVTGLREDYEYGNVALLYGIAEKTVLPILRDAFPYLHQRIITYAILRLVNPLPMKSVGYEYEKTYLSKVMDESMSPQSISGMLSSLPEDRCRDVMRRMTGSGEYILIDSTAIFSRSSNISIAELGHNARNIHVPQINLMMLFSSSRNEPTFVRVIPGSMRDVSSMAETIDMANVERCVVISDKGFYSIDNVKKLKNRHLSFIIPLRRNSSLIPERERMLGVFMYEGRPIKYFQPVEGVYAFEDPVLRMEEEKDYLVRIKERKSSRKSYEIDSKYFGRIHLLSDLNADPEEIYRLYKKREYVEYAFNVLKNDIEADRSYLRDDRMLSSWMFLNLLSLNLHFQILNMIDGKYSVRDVLLILSRIKVYDLGKQEMLGEIPKKSRELVEHLKIDLDILRKK